MMGMRFSKWIGAAGGVIILTAAAVASLIPANMQIRTGLHWQVEHFLAYFVATAIFCLAWPRPFIIAGAMVAFSALLEALQGLTPDRTPDLATALAAASGALTAGVLAWLVIRLRKLALAQAKQI
jgi:VanZ family protein